MFQENNVTLRKGQSFFQSSELCGTFGEFLVLSIDRFGSRWHKGLFHIHSEGFVAVPGINRSSVCKLPRSSSLFVSPTPSSAVQIQQHKNTCCNEYYFCIIIFWQEQHIPFSTSHTPSSPASQRTAADRLITTTLALLRSLPIAHKYLIIRELV